MAPHRGVPEEPVTIDRVLSLAMTKEQEAVQRYEALALRVGDRRMAGVLKAMASEETTHFRRLQAVAAGDLSVFAGTRLAVEPMTELMAVAEPGADASLPQVLLFAINAEQEAFRLYLRLAAAAADPGLATLLRALAAEEDLHRRHLDKLYHAEVFGEA